MWFIWEQGYDWHYNSDVRLLFNKRIYYIKQILDIRWGL